MRPHRLIWQLFPTYLLVTVASLLAVTFYTSRAVREFYLVQMEQDLQTRVALLEPQIAGYISPIHLVPLQRIVRDRGAATGTRFTVIRPDGVVIADSNETPQTMDNHGTRPEVAAARRSGAGNAVRHSDTLGTKMMYTAMRMPGTAETAPIIRVAIPVTFIDESLWAIYARLSSGGIVIALLAAGVSWAVSKRIIRPLEELKRGAEEFSRGDLSARIPVPGSVEFSGLAEAMNKMASELDERIQNATRQRNEQEAVLASMVESVIAVDNAGCIISLNRAGARLLEVDAGDAQGRPMEKIFGNVSLEQFVRHALNSSEAIEAEIVMEENGELVLQAHGTVLRDADGKAIGALIVLNDVTRLRRLERVRRDFVANVSHELKTPITSIKGFVETLLDGALHSPQDSERFLRIVAKQADRLNAIIEDLLALSRIEQDEEVAESFLETSNLNGVIAAATQLCAGGADAKDITLAVECDARARADINSPLLEQGIVNLVDNAIKYSDPGSTVRIHAGQENGHVVISVTDQGCGIPREHLPRLFERFYRVDKARSRSLGGTGLGLAIVKHIAQTHGGRVSVQSEPGHGSTFAIHIPNR